MVIMLRVNTTKRLRTRKPYYAYNRAVKVPRYARKTNVRKT